MIRMRMVSLCVFFAVWFGLVWFGCLSCLVGVAGAGDGDGYCLLVT